MMARFYFRLENVLKLREKIEQNKLLEFSRKRRRLLELEKELESQAGKLSDFIKNNSIADGIFTVSELVAMENYMYRIRLKINELKEHIKKKEQETAAALQQLIEAKKSKKVMENLKNRQWERFIFNLNKQEEIELDEVNQKIGLNRERLTIEDLPTEEM